MPIVLIVIAAAAAASLLAVAPAPGYDPWTWLLWGREVAGGSLSTVDGPAFKPLPVAVCALLAPLGGAAPVLWVWLVRAGACAAVWLAWVLGRELGGGSRLAGALAAAGVALTGGFALQASVGGEAPLVAAFALAGAAAWRAGRLRAALACGAACALLRVEAWPFLLVAGAVAWRREPGVRPWLVALAAAIPAAWFVPEWIGSGDPLRSGARARVPNPGQPALADVPALASLGAAAELVLAPLWLGAVLALRDRRARLVVAAGGAWIALVAVMAQAGFSGEPRYALPGAVVIALGAAAALARSHRRALVAAAAALLLVAALPRLAGLGAIRAAQAHQWALARDLDGAVRAAGGREAVLACGRPYVGRYRGPLMAYRLGVTKRTVEPDDPPRPPGVVFRARLTAASPPAPAAGRGFARRARVGEWDVLARCTPN